MKTNTPSVNTNEDRHIRLDIEDVQILLERIQNILETSHLVEKYEEATESKKPLNEREFLPLRHILTQLHPADIADILSAFSSARTRLTIWSQVDDEDQGDVLLEVDEWLRDELIQTLDSEDLFDIAQELDTDELADLVQDLPDEMIAEVQKGLTDAERHQLKAAMEYAEGTVGAMMDFEMVRVRDDVTLEVVLRYLRRLHELPDHTDKLFVVDHNDRLQGVLSIDTLLTEDPDDIVGDVMRQEVFTLSPGDKDIEASSAFERYNLISAPVVDEHNRIIGRVTIDKVLDVIIEDAEEESMGRSGLGEDEDIFAPVLYGFKRRTPWFLINLCTAVTAALVASRFQGTVSQIIVLTFLMGIVNGIGGNAGNQSLTLVVRAIASGQVNPHNHLRTVIRMVWRELRVNLAIALVGGTAAGVFAWYFASQDSSQITVHIAWEIGCVMAAALTLNMLLGSFMGIVIPMARHRHGRDPAIGSGILLTFCTDAMGFFIFLGLATLFLLPLLPK